MKQFKWNQKKNELLKKARGISFEEMVEAYHNGGLVDIIDHYNKNKYTNQKIMLININNYIYLVPFIYQEDCKFLKTIIPSGKYTKKLLVNK